VQQGESVVAAASKNSNEPLKDESPNHTRDDAQKCGVSLHYGAPSEISRHGITSDLTLWREHASHPTLPPSLPSSKPRIPREMILRRGPDGGWTPRNSKSAYARRDIV